ncbi:MAG: SlyX family protein [Hyphomicrobiaceae bacterium]|nr:SlyX family protein [Hyphomicrobiaceae bacterium]MCC0024196.1 SlyX family protein [Hyphomicrobiaceae bacterium]
MTDPDVSARLQRLEETVADQGRLIDDLNEVITDQWKQIEKLQRDLERFAEELAEIESGDPERGRITKPPHY